MKKILMLSALLAPAFTCLAQNIHRAAAADKSVTGMTSGGGSKGYGLAYQYTPQNGQDSILFNFNGRNGKSLFLGNPTGNVIQASNGIFYGMAPYGGIYNLGGIFIYNPLTGKDTIVLNFDYIDGELPNGSLMQASNGKLYGLTSYGGIYGYGVLFSIDPNTFIPTVLVNFRSTTEANPMGSLIQASDGYLYGLSSNGGSSNNGTLFRFNTATNKDSILLSFSGGGKEANPNGSLIQASNGLLYGMSEFGGSIGYGTIFSYNTSTFKDSVLVNFSGSGANPGANPMGSLVQASNGLIYGMTGNGGPSDQGVLFQFNTATGKDSVLLNFNGTNGAGPDGTLMQDPVNGLLYGMTQFGGNTGGCIFSYNTVTYKDSVLMNFGGNNGDQPYADLLKGKDSLLYGMTAYGGLGGNGVLFRINPVTLKDSVLINFVTGGGPVQNNLVQAQNGQIYGMTYSGGTSDNGTIVRYNPSTGKDSVIFNFSDIDGALPNGALIQESNGLLYGLTSAGGTNENGVLFSFDPATNKDSVLVKFNNLLGTMPNGSLVQASDGNLYGLTSAEGKFLHGTLFRFNPATGKDTVLYNFTGVTGGAAPSSTLVQAADGWLYGTTQYGGANLSGLLFRFNPVTYQYSVLYSFNNAVASNPQGNVLVDTASHLVYCTGDSGGANNYGCLFSYNMNTHVATDLISFNISDGAFPTGILLWDTAANYIYSTTYQGGAYNYGVLYRYNITTGMDTILLNFNDSIGANPCGIMLNGNGPQSVNEVPAPKNLIVVYPNPCRNLATVLFGSQGTHYIELDDIGGRQVEMLKASGMQYTLSRNGLASGMYFLRFYDNGMRYLSTSKLIVQ
ncbi:MAG: T9SS type A sorting domain-containing protein [Bacteroidia bacterium]|nr:T9SS type A sorting domain-containing protein [Bacteroidia bacterium]